MTSKVNLYNTIEILGITGLGYLVFVVIFSYLGFTFGYTVSPYIIPITCVIYCILSIFALSFLKNRWVDSAAALILFLVSFVTMSYISHNYFTRTYDTSWDGQGYHSNGVLSLSFGWNPLFDKDLPAKFPDASIFVKGYPKALWTIQSSIYMATGRIDAAKITNLVAILIALLLCFTFFKRLRLNTVLSAALACLLVVQPPFIMQLFTFSADLFSYEMVLVAISALGLFVIETDINKNLVTFTLAELLLLGSKYSNLPIVATLAMLFVAIAIVVKMDYANMRLNRYLAGLLICSAFVIVTAMYVPNLIYHKHALYPSNLDGISYTFREDNVPSNLRDSSNAELVFYSVFSESQLKRVGKNDPSNIAKLKIPFAFASEEVMQSASIYNNRVGAAGPLYSGVFVSVAVLGMSMFLLKSRVEGNLRLLIAGALVGLCFLLTLINPAPNLIRYNIQLVLIPFIVIVAALALYKTPLVRLLAYASIVTLVANAALFSGAFVEKTVKETAEIGVQMNSFKATDSQYTVKASNFYSNYVRLYEFGIPFVVNKNLNCNGEYLAQSHFTTKICRVNMSSN